jgi:hypothetical protein
MDAHGPEGTRYVGRYCHVLKLAYEMTALFPDIPEVKEPIFGRKSLSMLDLNPRPKEAIEPNNFV